MRDRVRRLQEKACGPMTFTIEPARGATYSTGTPTIYAHDRWPRGSVLEGQDRRSFVGDFPTVEQAVEACTEMGIEATVIEGTTYVDIDSMVAHLPEDEG